MLYFSLINFLHLLVYKLMSMKILAALENEIAYLLQYSGLKRSGLCLLYAALPL